MDLGPDRAPGQRAPHVRPTTSNLLATFAYNPASQIVTRTRNNDAYVWTGANRLDSYSVNGLNQYVSVNNVNFAHDANGNLTTEPAPAEAGDTRSYVYDVENRLVSSTSGGATTTLRYDPLGRLWEVAAPSGTTRFLWDGDALVSEYTGTNDFRHRYAHGSSAGDDPIVWTEVGGTTRYLHADHQGSIVAIAGANGGSYAINRYDEWGVPAAGNQGRFGFTGQIWLPEIGLYYYKARMLSPGLGRFMQVDPVGYGGGINLYAYVDNDPFNLEDPTGNVPLEGTESERTFIEVNRDLGRQIFESPTKVDDAALMGTVGVMAAGPIALLVAPEAATTATAASTAEAVVGRAASQVVTIPTARAASSLRAPTVPQGRAQMVSRGSDGRVVRSPAATEQRVARTIQAERMPREVGGAHGTAHVQRELPQARTTGQRIAEVIRIGLRILNPID